MPALGQTTHHGEYMHNEVINNVVEALDRVDESYYFIEDMAYDRGLLIDSGKIRKLERRFMHEFSIRYSEIMAENKESYIGLKYDFEVPKKFMWYENPDYRIRETWERLNDKIGREINMLDYWEKEPDFLVHANQKDLSPENQKLIIEAKTNPNTSKNEMLKDIFHTCIYANKYAFQNNVLLLVNIDENKWRDCLSDYIDSNYYHGSYKNFKKIYVIFKEGFNEKSRVFRFSEIIDKYLTKKSR